ncbi:DNA-binding protein [Rummeliibacillus sp. TYF-LIM-RU47]|uniref:DNA-binding protein n=1 Tax=Rummeliibacillus sp. TYF-LIM-RU47 TaxID=2608406 RepID=UPI001CC2475C|nr:DNA-binding protein [Rummeliibacillus sp. TYF-LIM-RU47]
MQEKELKQLLQTLLNDLVEDFKKKLTCNKEWMTLKEGAAYADVSYNTLMKLRLSGLRVFEIDGIKRISKTEIDNFFKKNSF